MRPAKPLIAVRIAFFAVCAFGASVCAQDRDQGYGRDGHDRDRRMDQHRHFDDRDRQILRDWYRDHASDMEPRDQDNRWNNEEMERDLQVDRTLDPGMRRWSRPVPEQLSERLGPLPQHWRYVMLGYNVCIVDDNWTIHDVFTDQFNDHDRRVIQDWNRDHPDAVKQFLGGFGVRIDNGDLDRRTQVGMILDPDLQDRARPAPEELVNRLNVPPRDWRYVVVGDRLCLVDDHWEFMNHLTSSTDRSAHASLVCDTIEKLRARIRVRLNRSMQHPSGHLIWQYVQDGPILWGCSSLLPKQDAFSLLLCLRMFLSLWKSWTSDFLLVLRRPIETAGNSGKIEK